jgi:hypothetical protein
MWRVFWVPQDTVRRGVRQRVLKRWEDLPIREDDTGIQACPEVSTRPETGSPCASMSPGRARNLITYPSPDGPAGQGYVSVATTVWL